MPYKLPFEFDQDAKLSEKISRSTLPKGFRKGDHFYRREAYSRLRQKFASELDWKCPICGGLELNLSNWFVEPETRELRCRACALSGYSCAILNLRLTDPRPLSEEFIADLAVCDRAFAYAEGRAKIDLPRRFPREFLAACSRNGWMPQNFVEMRKWIAVPVEVISAMELGETEKEWVMRHFESTPFLRVQSHMNSYIRLAKFPRHIRAMFLSNIGANSNTLPRRFENRTPFLISAEDSQKFVARLQTIEGKFRSGKFEGCESLKKRNFA